VRKERIRTKFDRLQHHMLYYLDNIVKVNLSFCENGKMVVPRPSSQFGIL